MKIRFVALALMIPSALAVACSGSPSPSSLADEKTPPAAVAVKPLASHHLAMDPASLRARAPWNAAGEQAAASASRGPSVGPECPTYPAFQPNGPQVVNQKGAKVLSQMEIVTVTFNDDGNAAGFEMLSDGIGTSPDWAMLSEYGIGPAKSGPNDHVHATLAGATVTEAQLQALVEAKVADPSSGWPANDGNQLYAFYIPAGMFAIADDAGNTYPWCEYNWGAAYHASVQPTDASGAASGLPISYAILPQCPGLPFDSTTDAASHEYAETATDPGVVSASRTAYEGYDQAHVAYAMYQGLWNSEIGDACEFFGESTYESAPPFTFQLQRLWSNKNELLGHDPCTPEVSSEPYYNATTFANQLQTISVDWTLLPGTCAQGPFLCPKTTQGIKVPLGQSATFDIGFYSDAPTDDWTLVAVTNPFMPLTDDSGNPIANGTVKVTIDQPTGNNGHRAHVTVTPLTAGAMGLEYIELQSGESRSYEARTVPILIGQQ